MALQEQMSMFDNGGMMDEGNSVDPVSGNTVPVGSLQEEVRDDVPAQVSAGEMVIPGDVVRYFGLEFFMKLRDEAKRGLARMEDIGQMGNSDTATLDPDTPFEVADLEMTDDSSISSMTMNRGGSIPTAEELGDTPPPIRAFQGRNISGPEPTGNTAAGLFGTGSVSVGRTTSSGTETKKYRGPGGETLPIQFINGVAQTTIPNGYVTEAEYQKKVAANKTGTTSQPWETATEQGSGQDNPQGSNNASLSEMKEQGNVLGVAQTASMSDLVTAAFDGLVSSGMMPSLAAQMVASQFDTHGLMNAATVDRQNAVTSLSRDFGLKADTIAALTDLQTKGIFNIGAVNDILSRDPVAVKAMKDFTDVREGNAAAAGYDSAMGAPVGTTTNMGNLGQAFGNVGVVSVNNVGVSAVSLGKHGTLGNPVGGSLAKNAIAQFNRDRKAREAPDMPLGGLPGAPTTSGTATGPELGQMGGRGAGSGGSGQQAGGSAPGEAVSSTDTTGGLGGMGGGPQSPGAAMGHGETDAMGGTPDADDTGTPEAGFTAKGGLIQRPKRKASKKTKNKKRGLVSRPEIKAARGTIIGRPSDSILSTGTQSTADTGATLFGDESVAAGNNTTTTPETPTAPDKKVPTHNYLDPGNMRFNARQYREFQRSFSRANLGGLSNDTLDKYIRRDPASPDDNPLYVYTGSPIGPSSRGVAENNMGGFSPITQPDIRYAGGGREGKLFKDFPRDVFNMLKMGLEEIDLSA